MQDISSSRTLHSLHSINISRMSSESWNEWSNYNEVVCKEESGQGFSFPIQSLPPLHVDTPFSSDQEEIQRDLGMQESEFMSFPLLDMFGYSDPLYASLDILPTPQDNTTLMQGDYFFCNYGNEYEKLDPELQFNYNDDQPPNLLLLSDNDNNNYGDVKSHGSSDHHKEEDHKKKITITTKGQSSSNTKIMLTKEEVSKYFYMPITQAARELNIGLTLLKKRCRELGIPRWPHRKLKSYQALIQNIKELKKEKEGEEKVREAVGILELEKKLIEETPDLKMMEKTKRLRQACFKATYKKKKKKNTKSTMPTTLMIMDGSDHFDEFVSASSTNEEDVKTFINIF